MNEKQKVKRKVKVGKLFEDEEEWEAPQTKASTTSEIKRRKGGAYDIDDEKGKFKKFQNKFNKGSTTKQSTINFFK